MLPTKNLSPKPEITLKGVILALIFAVLYTVLSALIIAGSQDLSFINVFKGEAMGTTLMVIYMVPVWYGVVRELHFIKGWIKLLLHLILGVTLSVVWYYSYLGAFDLFFGLERLGEGLEAFKDNKYWIILTTFMIYAITFAVIHIIQSVKQLREVEKRSAELKEHSRNLEFANLKAQLNPHFLFNTLNSISATVTKDPEGTRQMIAKLSEMLRYSLDSFEKRQVSFADELKFVRTYLDLEQRRFGDRLKVHFDIDRGIRDLPVPPMILQPLVENAVKHGIAPLEEGGLVQIQATEHADEIVFSIQDTGRGMPEDFDFKEKKDGIGLRNINEMLIKRYGEPHGLEITATRPKGTKISFSIPLQ